MKLLIDTNVIMDIFLKREPFFESSYSALRKAAENGHECYISATAATDIFYILRKSLKSSEQAKEYMGTLSQLAYFADALSADILTALSRDMPDFEDAVVDAIAERIKADYILTRNTKDFAGSKVPASTPADFVERQEE